MPCASLTWAWRSATRVETPVTLAVWSWHLELPSGWFVEKKRRQSANTFVISHHARFMFWGRLCAKQQKKLVTAFGSQGSFEKFECKFQVFSYLHPSLEGMSWLPKIQHVVVGWSKEWRRRVWTPVARLLLRLLLCGLQQGGYWADLLRTLLSQPLGGGPGRGGRMHGALLQLGCLCCAGRDYTAKSVLFSTF